MKYNPGSYKIYFFDAVGGKLPDSTIMGDNFIDCTQIGDDVLLQERKESSFVVMRVLYNSASQSNKTWD